MTLILQCNASHYCSGTTPPLLLLRDHAAAAIGRDSAAVFAWKGEILQELFSRHRGPGAVYQARRIHDPEHCRREEVAVGAGARRKDGNKLGGR